MLTLNTQEKILAIKGASANNVTLLLDFDRTITCGTGLNGNPLPSIVSTMRNGSEVSQEYAAEAKALYAHYYPIEQDQTIPSEEKSKLMEEWWTAHYALRMKYYLTLNHLKEAIKSPDLRFRPGVAKMLEEAHQKGVQVVILSSAGLGYDSIELLLERDGLMYDNIRIISNQMIWDDSGLMIGYKKPLIHSGNKCSFLKSGDVHKYVILVGDSLNDASMLADSTDTTPEGDRKIILRFGVYENRDLTALCRYQEAFDIVMVNDQISFDRVTELL